MAWMSKAYAVGQSGAEAASGVYSWLDGIGAVVKTDHAKTTGKFYSRKFSLVQDVTTDTREIRGLAQDLAEFLADGLVSDNTRDDVYLAFAEAEKSGSNYKLVRLDRVDVVVGPRSASTTRVKIYVGGSSYSSERAVYMPTEGRVATATARRANEAGGWAVTYVVTTYGVPYTADARNVFTPETDAFDGIVGSTLDVVGKSSSRTFVFTFANATLYQTEDTTVYEAKGLTRSAAEAMVAANTADASYATVSKASGSIKVYRQVRSGTGKTASARFVDDDNGWTVTVNQTDYGYTGW